MFYLRTKFACVANSMNVEYSYASVYASNFVARVLSAEYIHQRCTERVKQPTRSPLLFIPCPPGIKPFAAGVAQEKGDGARCGQTAVFWVDLDNFE